MPLLRAFLLDHRRLAALVLAVALCLKALVPAGYMPGQQGTVLTVQVCADTQGQSLTRQIVIPSQDVPGKETGNHAKADSGCPYSALGMASLEGADAVLLGLALAFILALGFASAPAPRIRRAPHLRPPLRGPPVLA